MKRHLTLICTKNYSNDTCSFNKDKSYKGMIRFMMNRDNGEIQKAIRVKDDNNKRILIYEVEDRDFLYEHFTILVDDI